MQDKNIIFKAIVGSQAYGTAIEGKSDIDHKGIYMNTIDELITFGYVEQVNVTKDDTFYEVRRYLELLQMGNPTMLELLYSPKDCIITKTPEFDLIMEHRDKFLTQKCLQSFGGYAIAQIKKAKGLNKKMNWEKDKVTRKTPLDFVYVEENGKTIPIEQWLNKNGKKQEFCGLVALNHMKDCYALYYDVYSHEKELDNTHFDTNVPSLGFHGIVLEDSNDIRLSSVPKGINPLCIVFYSKESYSRHCLHYREYQEWLQNRNTQRYVDFNAHGQSYDGKNLLHCRRLLDTAIEIATQKTVNVRRPNADYLLKIRRGEVALDEIIAQAGADIDGLEELYAKSGLPMDVDKQFVNELLLKIRKLKWA